MAGDHAAGRLRRDRCCVSLGGCLRAPIPTAATDDAAAESYVRLVLALGQHDAAFVDAYYGPPEWRTAAEQREAVARSTSTSAPRCSKWTCGGCRRSRPATRRCRAGRAAPAVPGPAAQRAARPRGDAAGPQVPVRRGVARALRRGGAAQRRGDVPGGDRRRGGAHRRQRRAGAPLRGVPPGVRHPARQARRGVPGGDRRVPPPDPGAPGPAARASASPWPT